MVWLNRSPIPEGRYFIVQMIFTCLSSYRGGGTAPCGFIPCRDVGTTGGVQDCSAARMRAGAAPGHQLQDGGTVQHCHRQAVQAGPQKDLPLKFFCDF
jgi:hypothetical protein